MDSFEGAASDPASLHKYAYCNGDPVNNSDSSGHFTITETLTAQNVGLKARFAFAGLLGGLGGTSSAFDPAIGSGYNASAGELGAAFAQGFGAGFVLGFTATYYPNAVAVGGAFLGGASVGGALDSAINQGGVGNWSQVLFRAGTLGLGFAAPKSVTVRNLTAAFFEYFANLGSLVGRLGGKVLTVSRLQSLKANLKTKYGVTLRTADDAFLDELGARRNPPAAIGAAWDPEGKVIHLRRNATEYELQHEMLHMADDLGPNPPGTRLEAETRVYDALSQQKWLTKDEAIHAYRYYLRVRAEEGEK